MANKEHEQSEAEYYILGQFYSPPIEEVMRRCEGQRIKAIKLDEEENKFYITFDSGKTLQVWDDDYQCCEIRYLHTDDDLSSFVGSKFIKFRVDKLHTHETQNGEHEIGFLNFITSYGVIVVETHNENNGWYGGFRVCADIIG